MSKRKKTAKPSPTQAELEILQVLWEHGPATVKFVNEKLNPKRNVGYTTTLKIMIIMKDKGLVVRDESRRAHVYAVSQSVDHMQKKLVSELMEKVFSGSAYKLIMHALSAKPATEKELDQIRALLNKMKTGKS